VQLTICYNSYSPTYYYGIKRKHWTVWIGFYPNLRETRVTQEEVEFRRQAGLNRYQRAGRENHWPIVRTDALRQLLLGQKCGDRISR